MHKIIQSLLITVIILACSISNAAPGNFSESKRIARKIFNEHPQTLYCGCAYNQSYQIDLSSCHMDAAKNIKRANRIEYEHMMPAENFGRQFQCWREPLCHRNGKKYKGRKCCGQIDMKFKAAEAELYNLWPAVGLVNQARSNYRFSMLDSKKGFFGCDIEIDTTLRKVEPPNRAKGIVARANLFMSVKYNVSLSPAQRNLFNAWNHQFPPTPWEINWAAQVAQIEGYSNPYIDAYNTQIKQ